ncbi:MAG: NAD(P)H-dependent glycerol-3-phosphate dehydrogenase [Myxococcota bacterium]
MSATNPVRCAVLGAGSFGTCLALRLAQRDYAVDLWARDGAVVEAIRRHRRNPRYLKEFQLPENIRPTLSLDEALEAKEVVLSVIPSHAVRDVWTRAAPLLAPGALIISASKGIEVGTGKLVSQVLREILPAEACTRLVTLSGPSFALEIAQGRPTGVSLACANETYAIAAQSILSSPAFRCYTNPDVTGVELGGALKNVIAIAVGIGDGLGLGLNSRAALITRGLAEMTRLGQQLGAQPLTFLGLSGIGDLVLTCTGDLSRNRRVGLELGSGRKVDEVLDGLTQVAEGVRTTRSAYELARKHGVDMPITEQAYAVLYQGKDCRSAVRDLTHRQLRSERE